MPKVATHQDNSVFAEKTPTPRKKKYLGAISFVLLLVATFTLLFNYNFIIDTLSTIGYSASPEIDAIEQRLALTDSARLVYRASSPALEGREDFNRHCQSHSSEVSILGCYTNRAIYLYQISEPSLNGIVESTAAHELLHGIWARLGAFDQAKLSSALQDFYQAHPELAEELSEYDEDELLDEIHARIGTEYADLPEALEVHYAKYFQNQDAIVSYYQQYSAEFSNLKNRLEELDATIEEKQSHVERLQADYETDASELNSAIDEFNSCADTPGCFTEATFSARRAELLSAQADLESLYSELSTAIDDYNHLVDEYNANVLRSRTLENAVNSNSAPSDNI